MPICDFPPALSQPPVLKTSLLEANKTASQHTSGRVSPTKSCCRVMAKRGETGDGPFDSSKGRTNGQWRFLTNGLAALLPTQTSVRPKRTSQLATPAVAQRPPLPGRSSRCDAGTRPSSPGRTRRAQRKLGRHGSKEGSTKKQTL